MPADIPYEWTETDHSLTITLSTRVTIGDVLITDCFVKVNAAGSLLTIDLFDQINPETSSWSHPCLNLVKMKPGIWKQLKTPLPQEERKGRRAQSIKAAEQRDAAKREERKAEEFRKIRASETHQWKQDAESKETLNTWKFVEKTKAEALIYAEPSEPVIARVSEIAPVRSGHTLAMSFTPRAVAGAPARDRPGREPPVPKEHTVSASTLIDDDNPMWLKDHGDTLASQGEYKSAYLAYSRGLEKSSISMLALICKLHANRAVVSIYLGRITQAIDDCFSALSILNKSSDTAIEGVLRVALNSRLSRCYLYLGDIRNASRHIDEAVKVARTSLIIHGKEVAKLLEDKKAIDYSLNSLPLKKKADSLIKQKHFSAAADEYSKIPCVEWNATIASNLCLALLQSGKLDACIDQGEAALSLLAAWSLPQEKPQLPTKLLPKLCACANPPWFDDPTAPTNGKEEQWLMKHEGKINDPNELPQIPDGWQWVREASKDDQWIAIRKAIPRSDIDRIQTALAQLRDASFSQNSCVIRAAVDETKRNHPELTKACKQAIEYATLIDETLQLQETHLASLSVKQPKLGCREAVHAMKSSKVFIQEHMVNTCRKRLASKVVQRLIEAAGDQGLMEKLDEYAKMAESVA